MEIAWVTYNALEDIRPLPFTLSDALFGCFLHDIEKIWKHALDPQDKQRVYKDEILRENFTLHPDHWNAIKYAHGEGDDYHPTDRIQLPLAAFVHHCDNTSARIWFDQPQAEREEQKEQIGDYTCLILVERYNMSTDEIKNMPTALRDKLVAYAQERHLNG